MPVIKARALELCVRDLKAHRPDQMQARARSGAGARDIAGILGDLWLDQHDVECRHDAFLSIGRRARACDEPPAAEAAGGVRPGQGRARRGPFFKNAGNSFYNVPFFRRFSQAQAPCTARRKKIFEKRRKSCVFAQILADARVWVKGV